MPTRKSLLSSIRPKMTKSKYATPSVAIIHQPSRNGWSRCSGAFAPPPVSRRKNQHLRRAHA